MKRFGSILFLTGLLWAGQAQAGATISPVFSEPGVWTSDIEGARWYAQSENQFFLINFGRTLGCSYCFELQASVYDKPGFTAWAASNRVALVYADYDAGSNDPLVQEVHRRYPTAINFPTIIVVLPSDGVTAIGQFHAVRNRSYNGQKLTPLNPTSFASMVMSCSDDWNDPYDNVATNAWAVGFAQDWPMWPEGGRTLTRTDTKDWFAFTNVVAGQRYELGQLSYGNEFDEAVVLPTYLLCTNQATAMAKQAWKTLSFSEEEASDTFVSPVSGTLYVCATIAYPVTNRLVEAENSHSLYALRHRVCGVPGPELDAGDLVWSTGGDAAWYGQWRESYDGNDAACSGPLENDQASWLETTVTGSGTISFRWRVSSEYDYDKLSFSVDGVEQTNSSGTLEGWVQQSFVLTAGQHTLRWVYSKDGSLDEGEDCGWLDQVSWTPTGFAVMFDACGGTVSPATQPVTPGAAYGALPVPVRAGYSFDGWWTGPDATGERVTETTIVGPADTLYAAWAPLTCNVLFDPAGGTVTRELKSATYGQAYGALPVPSRAGYSFMGWWLTLNGVAGLEAANTRVPVATNHTLVAKWERNEAALYLVVDLSGGPGSASYPFSYLSAIPAGGWSDEYKTTRLVLRKIPAGVFTMGSPADELGRVENETQHEVTLTKDFYAGVFEVTQRQWELVMGTRPSYFDNAACYAARPVESVSYDDVRGSVAGAAWPASSAVDAASFIGRLRAKTGLSAFDLPTEAQWEYACRAGTATALNSGKNLTAEDRCDNLDVAARYGYNSGALLPDGSIDGVAPDAGTNQGTAKVGSYLSNAWGLYDAHGNVAEWALDSYGAYAGAVSDPVGAGVSPVRIFRGGFWWYDAMWCRSANRNSNGSGVQDYGIGFRVFQTLTSSALDPVIVTVNALPDGVVDSAYSVSFEVSGGMAPYTWTLVSGSLPAGLTLTTSGELRGTPTAVGSSSFTVRVTDRNARSATRAFNLAIYASGDQQYVVIDLAGGPGASNYPISYLSDVPAGGWMDAYKTSKLVLRRIPAGSFTMGSPANELGRNPSGDETQHEVSLSKVCYAGVFEVTQRQWELVMGKKPSYFNHAAYYATRPVEGVSYVDIRGSAAGAGWPASSAVDATSFIGRLRTRTGLVTIDLPTEAQWEYACRASTMSALNSGKDLTHTRACPNMAELGRYASNTVGVASQSSATNAATAKVGCYLPNTWGLYDTHGNVWELCLDLYGVYKMGAETDPKGSATGTNRVIRGGSYYQEARNCRSALRWTNSNNAKYIDVGLRLVGTLGTHPPDVTSRSPVAEQVTVGEGATATLSVTANDVADPDTATRGMLAVSWFVEGALKQVTKSGAPNAIASVFAYKPGFDTVSGTVSRVVTVKAVAQDRQGGTTETAWSVCVTNTPVAQQLTFKTLPVKVTGDADFDPGATASSLLPVVYSSGNSAVAVIASNRVRIVGAGSAVITALQQGSVDFQPATATQTLTVKARLTTHIPGGGGSVSGAGAYVPGTRVTLTARPQSGYTFRRWEDGSQSPTRTFVMSTADVAVTAEFMLTQNVSRPTIGTVSDQNATVGVFYSMPFEIQSDTLPTVTVSGLPAGLKYDATTLSLAGVPAASGSKLVTVTVRNASGQTSGMTFWMTVESLPAWAQGTFNGWHMDSILGAGQISASVSALGKISGKIMVWGTNHTFGAASYFRTNAYPDAFCVRAEVKTGKSVLVLNCRISSLDIGTPQLLSVAEGDVMIGEAGCQNVVLYRNVWTDADMRSVATNYTGYYTAALPNLPSADASDDVAGSGYLTFTVDKTGGVKSAGKLADGTAVSTSAPLIIDENGAVFMVVNVVPAAYKGGSLFGFVEWCLPEQADAGIALRLLESRRVLQWGNLNPLATARYGDGFSRELDLIGGWYDLIGNLYRYYDGMTLQVGISEDAADPAPLLFVGTNRYESVYWEPTGVETHVVTNRSGVMTGLVAPRAGTPVKVGGAYNYGETENDVGLTLSLTRNTGVFKGQFKAWFDYGTTHTYKSVAYEGVLTPETGATFDGVAGRGFFLWADKASYLNPLNKPVPYTFNWSYDFLLLGL